MQRSKLNTFDSNNSELLTGINLIEASAGSGKTYTIAMLVLRFVVEQGLDLKKVLAVTFTQAASAELKERVRTRLVEARQVFTAQQATADGDLQQWIAKLNRLELEPSLIIKRLNQALFEIDRATITTIHGFCQRLLSSYALETGQLFGLELSTNSSTIKQACSDDFWRQHVYPRAAWEAAVLLADYKTPEQLQASVEGIADDWEVVPDYQELDTQFVHLKAQINAKKKGIITALQRIQQALPEQKFSAKFSTHFANNSEAVRAWLEQKTTTPADFFVFTHAGLMTGLHGGKFRQSQKNPASSEQQKTDYIQALAINDTDFSAIDNAIKNIKLLFRRALLQHLRENLDSHLEQCNSLSFDQLISKLEGALRGPQRQRLIAEIKQNYSVALIDEFQDTDAKQWHIIRSLFSSKDQYLYLIGDPKQAIYKFRGADINSYFVAQQQAHHHFTLHRNWRSSPHLVAGVNALFKKPNPFNDERLNFYPASSALEAEQSTLKRHGEPLPPVVLWQLDNGEQKPQKQAIEERLQAEIKNEIARLLRPEFSLQNERAIHAGDIAILVNSNAQAKAFRRALNKAGISALTNSRESVFAAAEAVDLHLLLQAIAQPTDNTLVKPALTLSWFNVTGAQFVQASNDDRSYEGWVARLQDYQLLWRDGGLMTMMYRLIEREKVQTRLSTLPHAERIITNLQHIIECVQQAATDARLGINKTLDWLARNIATAASAKVTSDELQLRLESDADAVNIITIHSAKGLEFPIVFCPFLWQHSNRLKREKQLITCYQEQHMLADLGTDAFESHRSAAVQEELSEQLRVCYVAVTRAQYRCYISWAGARDSSDSALAYLLTQQAHLATYSSEQPEVFDYRLLTLTAPEPEPYEYPSTALTLTARQRQRQLYTWWQMSSYSALSSLSFDPASEPTEVSEDKAREQWVSDVPQAEQNELPRGTAIGNVIHDLLENNLFSTLAEQHDISECRERACSRYGVTIKEPKQLDKLLAHTVSTVLTTDAGGFNLQQLEPQHWAKEMPFYLPTQRFNAKQINAILADCPTYKPLSDKIIGGYLTGFIDLICAYQGKYYVIDYKSNWLENYQQESLVKAMREHNYGLQYWLYSLVLHHYLQHKLANYQYQKHFGGVKYLFVRGMDNAQENSGVYQTRPTLAKIQQLSAIIVGDSNV